MAERMEQKALGSVLEVLLQYTGLGRQWVKYSTREFERGFEWCKCKLCGNLDVERKDLDERKVDIRSFGIAMAKSTGRKQYNSSMAR